MSISCQHLETNVCRPWPRSGSPRSDSHATGLPCAWPLHPHVFHMNFAISLFFLASSRHRYFRKYYFGREVKVHSERSCVLLSLAKQNSPCRGCIFPCSQACRSPGWRREREQELLAWLPPGCWAKSHLTGGLEIPFPLDGSISYSGSAAVFWSG